MALRDPDTDAALRAIIDSDGGTPSAAAGKASGASVPIAGSPAPKSGVPPTARVAAAKPPPGPPPGPNRPPGATGPPKAKGKNFTPADPKSRRSLKKAKQAQIAKSSGRASGPAVESPVPGAAVHLVTWLSFPSLFCCFHIWGSKSWKEGL